MKTKTPNARKYILLFALTFIIQYGIEHAVYVLMDAAYSGGLQISVSALSAIRLTAAYLIEAIEITSLAAATALLLLSLATEGVRRALLRFCAIAGTKLIYIIPHYYMSVISYGYDSLESLLISLPIAIGVLLAMLAELAAAIALGIIPAAVTAHRGGRGTLEVLSDDMSVREMLDVGNSATAAILIASAAIGFKFLISAAVNAIGFFIDVAGAFSAADVFDAIFSLIYPVLLMAVSYLLMQMIRNRSIATIDADEDDAKESGDNS